MTAPRFWARAQWLVLPLVVLCGAEWFVRRTADHVPTWYAAAQHVAWERPIGAVFIGSSRVQAAVVPEAFARALDGRRFKDAAVLNLARGYSTDVQHFVGLRNLIQAYPASLRGVQVFAEAPGGLPFCTHWRTSAWAHPLQPWMLVDLLRVSDLAGFMRSRQLELETRLHVSLRVLLRPLRLFNRRERVRQQWLEHVLPTLAAGGLPDLTPNEPVGLDLQGPGLGSSIRTDPTALASARASALEVADALERHQGPIRDWRGSIPEDLVRLVHGHGGRVIFLAPPLSDIFQRGYRTPLRREDLLLFERQVREWGACVVRPDFAYTDDDLPDLWHLRPELAPAYSRAVAASYERECVRDAAP